MVEGFVADALYRSAQLLTGGSRGQFAAGYFYLPTVLVDGPETQ